MKKKLQSFEALILFGLYFLPLILWSIFSFSHMKGSSHWTLFAMGLLIAALGTLALSLLTYQKTEAQSASPPLTVAKPEPAPAATAAPTPLAPDPLLLQEIESLKKQIETLKNDHPKELERLKIELTAAHEEAHQTLQEAQAALKEAEQASQNALHKKEELIEELKVKIQELEYEIKALIDFNEEAASYDLPPSEALLSGSLALNEAEASRILKKWLEAAAALAPSASGELSEHEPTGNLSKLIQGEPGALVFLYSLKEGKALFANPHSLTLFGLTPEEFASRFHTLLPKESLEWHEAVSKMADEKWAALPLKGARAVLAPVSRGPLQGYCLGVVF